MKDSGFFFVDGREVATTRQCCHCGCHFVSQKGSGVTRGWCLNCHGITCGGMHCDQCIPFEKKLEMVEKGSMHPSELK